MSRGVPADRGWRIATWDLSLSSEQAGHVRQLGDEIQHAIATKPPAWLVLDGWDDNPAGAHLRALYPAWASERRALPDPTFRGLEGMAPCVLPLQHFSHHEPDAAKRQDMFHDLLGLMWLDSQHRLVRQNVCGVLFTAASIDAVFDHWLLVRHQVPVGGASAFEFRQHDPRVLQRVWPSLSASQRSTLLGPVHSWWQLQAAWGPWSPSSMPKQGDFFLPGSEALCGPAPLWHSAAQDATAVAPSPTSPHRLINEMQRQRLLSGAAATQCWRHLALLQVAAELQPSALNMQRLCSQLLAWMSGHGLPWSHEWGSQWLVCTWLGRYSRRDEALLGIAQVDWSRAPWLERTPELIRRLRQEPDLSFGQHFDQLEEGLPS